MYDTGKIIIGIIVFLAIFSVPFWYNYVTDAAEDVAEPVIAPGAGDQCVEGVDFMRAKHMDLLNNWRNDRSDQDSILEYGKKRSIP